MTSTPAQQTPQQANIAKMRAVLDNINVKKQFQNALGEASGPFIASITEIYSSDTSLTACDPNLVIKEALKAATLRLPVIRSLGHAYIVPYKRKGVPIPTFVIGYKGLIQLAIRSGAYRTMNADVVYDGELEKVNKTTGEINFEGERTGDTVIGFFAHLELKSGFTKTLYMTKKDIENHAKKYSPSWGMKGGVWESNFEEMALKTVTRGLLSKWGILSIEMMTALASDAEESTPEQEEAVITTEVTYEDVTVETKTEKEPY
jgi:recombination protein RecT